MLITPMDFNPILSDFNRIEKVFTQLINYQSELQDNGFKDVFQALDSIILKNKLSIEDQIAQYFDFNPKEYSGFEFSEIRKVDENNKETVTRSARAFSKKKNIWVNLSEKKLIGAKK